MRIKTAKHIGFCFGVRRAVNIAQIALSKGNRLFCLGSLIHNPQEVKRLSRKGLTIVDDISDIKKGATLIIRSHGLLPGLISSARQKGIELIDATCPFVKKAQDICALLHKQRFDVIVIGDKAHPEVKALVGFAGAKAAVIENKKDLGLLKLKNKKIGIVAQTTQSKKNFNDLVSALLKKYKPQGAQIKVFNTICKDSSTRQAQAKRISSVCDVMIVVGGRNSANSRRLANICRSNVSQTYHIEKVSDLKPQWFGRAACVGVVSGSSTPDWIIKDVLKKLHKLLDRRDIFVPPLSRRS